MKKIFLSLILALSCLVCPLSLYAEGEDTGEIETITEEETPEKGNKKSNNSYYLALLAVAVLGLGFVGYTLRKRKDGEVDLELNYSCKNEDGSMTVSLGYNNSSKEKVKVNENNLNVTRGTAIILRNDEIETLDPGKHDNVLTAVINEETNLCWDIDGKTIEIDGSKLMNE